MSVPAALYWSRKRRKAAARVQAFSALIASPSVLTGGVAPAISSTLAMPANVLLAVSYSVGITSGQLVVNVNTGKTMGVPDLAADEIRELGYVEAGQLVDIELTAAVAGTATLYVLNDWRIPSSIATVVFT